MGLIVYCAYALMHTCDLLHAGSDSIPDDSSSDESSSQEMEYLPEAPHSQGPATEASDEDSDMEHEDASTARDEGM